MKHYIGADNGGLQKKVNNIGKKQPRPRIDIALEMSHYHGLIDAFYEDKCVL